MVLSVLVSLPTLKFVKINTSMEQKTTVQSAGFCVAKKDARSEIRDGFPNHLPNE